METRSRAIQKHFAQILSPNALEQVAGKLEHIEHPRKAMIAEKDQPFNYAYFPDEGMVSIVLVTTEGVPIEVGTVGKEGFVGIPILLGADISDRKLYSQVPGHGWSMDTGDFRKAVNEIAELRNLCQLFTLTMINQISQTAACNRLHTIEERCARWLLLAHDRDTSRTVDLTQEFLSMMLGGAKIRREYRCENPGKSRAYRTWSRLCANTRPQRNGASQLRLL